MENNKEDLLKPKKPVHRFKTSTHWFKVMLLYFIPLIGSYLWMSFILNPFEYLILTVMYFSWFAIYGIGYKGNTIHVDKIMYLSKKMNRITIEMAERLQKDRDQWKSRYFSLLSKQRKVVKSSKK